MWQLFCFVRQKLEQSFDHFSLKHIKNKKTICLSFSCATFGNHIKNHRKVWSQKNLQNQVVSLPIAEWSKIMTWNMVNDKFLFHGGSILKRRNSSPSSKYGYFLEVKVEENLLFTIATWWCSVLNFVLWSLFLWHSHYFSNEGLKLFNYYLVVLILSWTF